MLKASEFVPVGFDATVNAVGLTKGVGRLAARLLSKYGDLVSDEVGVGVPESRPSARGPIQLLFPDYGLLTVEMAWAKFECWYPPDAGPGGTWIPERMNWVVGLLEDILEIQRKPMLATSLQVTWLLLGETSTERLIRFLGLAGAMNGFFANSEDFQIQGDTKVDLPGLFEAQCQLTLGRFGDYEPPDDLGIQIKYWGPYAIGAEEPVRYTKEVARRFFSLAPQQMQKQLEQHFPSGGVS